MFDRHRHSRGERGGCLNPATLRNERTGELVMVFRDGMWRGPELTAEQIARLRGGAR